MDYRKPGEGRLTRRSIHPLHLAYLDHEWMLVAFDLTRGSLRNFLLARIAVLHATPRHFVPPADFDAHRYLAGSFGRFVGKQDIEVHIVFDSLAAPYIRERKWHSSQVLRELPEGAVEVTLHVNHLIEVQRWILSWASHAEAVSPPELRSSIAQELSVLCSHYKTTQKFPDPSAIPCPTRGDALPK